MFKMERDNRILVGAIVVFLIIFVVGVKFGGVSGHAVLDNSLSSIKVSPKVVSVGQIIQISVLPGSAGVNGKVSFYQAEDDLRKYSVTKLCNSYVCKDEGSFSFIVPSNWEVGVYYAKIYDYSTKSFVLDDFTVIG